MMHGQILKNLSDFLQKHNLVLVDSVIRIPMLKEQDTKCWVPVRFNKSVKIQGRRVNEKHRKLHFTSWPKGYLSLFYLKKNRNCVVHPMASIRYRGGANEECDDPIFMILSVFVYPWVWRGKAGRAFSGFQLFFLHLRNANFQPIWNH